MAARLVLGVVEAAEHAAPVVVVPARLQAARGGRGADSLRSPEDARASTKHPAGSPCSRSCPPPTLFKAGGRGRGAVGAVRLVGGVERLPRGVVEGVEVVADAGVRVAGDELPEALPHGEVPAAGLARRTRAPGRGPRGGCRAAFHPLGSEARAITCNRSDLSLSLRMRTPSNPCSCRPVSRVRRSSLRGPKWVGPRAQPPQHAP
eukprot:gene686-biopygen13312